MSTSATSAAAGIMQRYAERTGLVSGQAQRRYLWTDAFAVCNFLGLEASGADRRGGERARRLISAVHHTLGRHRADDPRRGWISGLSEEQGEAHPTAGGLRIGKPLPERPPGAGSDPRGEWDQDGQYFHYLTRWMHALDQAAWATAEARFNRWARELAARAFAAFSYLPAAGAPRRMYWKMSIDLTRPLVPAMGHHDPLDGYLTCLQLQSSAKRLPDHAGTDLAPLGGDVLEHEVRALSAMVQDRDWATDDPLGLGSLMTDAYRLFQIEQRGHHVPPSLLPALLGDIRSGLGHLLQQNLWQASANRRLAFRELGLAIGLQAIEQLRNRLPMGDGRDLARLLNPLAERRPLADRLTAFWLDRENQRAATWTDHLDINEVMLATALAPSGYLNLHLGHRGDHGHGHT